MKSHILPVTNPDTSSSSSSSASLTAMATASLIPIPSSATGGKVYLGSADDLHLAISSGFDDFGTMESRPLLSNTLSYTDTITCITPATTADWNSHQQQQQRRRRSPSENSLSPVLGDGGSAQPFHEVERVAEDTYIITRLSLKLLRYLGVGYRWVTRFLALGCYSILLLPGVLQVGYYYFRSSQVKRGIVFGDQPRNRLDLYLPKDSNGPKPVIAFVTGGAWVIGYKAWGSLLGQQLSERDIIVACIDYRNFPQGTIGDMVKDASEGISFICNHIVEYGGDPNRIYVMGQSAGAHIAACALVEKAIQEAGEGESSSWSLSQIKAYFGLSGGYNLLSLVDHFHNRGLSRKIFLSIMEGEESLQRYSPDLVVQDPNLRNAASLLPPIILFHGTADYTIPSDSSKSFAETLRNVGVEAKTILYEGKTHTDVFVQDPMRGGKDQLFEDIVAVIHEGDTDALAKDAKAAPRKRLAPEFMLRWAHNISPF